MNIKDLLKELKKLNQREKEGNEHYKCIKNILSIIFKDSGIEAQIKIKGYLVGGFQSDLIILKNEKVVSIIEYKIEEISQSEGKLPNLTIENNTYHIKNSYPNQGNDFFGQLRGYIGFAVRYNVCWINENKEKIIYPIDKEKIFGILPGLLKMIINILF